MAATLVSVRMPRRNGGRIERLATVLAEYPALRQVRVQFCDNGQRALVVPQSVAWSIQTPVEVSHEGA